MSTALFLVQIVYKFLTPATTTGGVPPGMPGNPAVLSRALAANLGAGKIMTCHCDEHLAHGHSWVAFSGACSGVVKCPIKWVYWTSPYSSHYRPYTDHGI